MQHVACMLLRASLDELALSTPVSAARCARDPTVISHLSSHQTCCAAGATTSGEVTHRKLSQPDHGFGRRCLHITWGSRGAVDIASLQLEVVTQPDQADFVLVHGTEGLGMPDGSVELMSLEELKEMVKRCGECGAPPMVLANPDIVTVSG